METFLAICLGIGLSAACGFRVFVPPLVISTASLYGHLRLSDGFEWIGTQEALIAFAIATLIEILAYYVPFLDNLLDTIAAPTALVAGTMVTASILTDVDPVIQWTVAVIAGGGSASIVGSLTGLSRLASTGVTAGLGNPVISTIELVISTLLSFLALTLPGLAALVVVGLLGFGISRLFKYLSQQRKSQILSAVDGDID